MASKIPVVGKNAITAVSTVLKPEAVAVLDDKLHHNIWATPSRSSPNAEQLKDGAIQRASVQPQGDALRFVKANPHHIGQYKREELNTKASASFWHSSPWDGQWHRYKIARIYMIQRKHVHCHPSNKSAGNGWTIDFSNTAMHKTPLMGWCRGTQDMFHNVQINFGRLADAVDYAKAMGWGYDITYPNYRWHTKKDYASNFKWKGPASPEVDYD